MRRDNFYKKGEIVMRKVVKICLFLFVVFLVNFSMPVVSYADGNMAAVQGYLRAKEQRRATEAARIGTIDENFYMLPGYNLNKIKTICVYETVPKGYEHNISDQYIVPKYYDLLPKIFDPKRIQFTPNETAQANFKLTPDVQSNPKSATADNYTNYIKQHFDGLLIVNILAFQQGNGSDVSLDFKLFDAEHGTKAVLAYNCSRFHANDNKANMIVEMTKNFKKIYFKKCGN